MQVIIQLLSDLVALNGRIEKLETQVAQLAQDGLICQKNPVLPLAEVVSDNYDPARLGGGQGGWVSPPVCEAKESPEVERERSGLEKRGGGGTVAAPQNFLPVLEADFPALNTPEVVAALNDWYEYRRERRLAKWQTRTVKQKLAEMAEYGPAGIVEAIQQSIGNGWQGLFAPQPVAAKSGRNAAGKAAEPTIVHGNPPSTPGDELRDEWYKWHSRVNGCVPNWVSSQQAMEDIEVLKQEMENRRQKKKVAK